jgi:hypothetical protein
MSNPVYEGSTLFAQNGQQSFAPQKGTTVTYKYCGTLAQCVSVFTQYRNLGYVNVVKVDYPGYSTVTADVPYDDAEYPIPQFEILNQQAEKSLLHSDTSTLQSLSEVQKNSIEEFFKKTEAYKNVIPNGLSGDNTALGVWILMMAGQKNVVQFQQILRKTYVCSQNYLSNNPPGVNNVGRIHSTGTMQGNAGVWSFLNSSLNGSSTVTKTFSRKAANTNTNQYSVSLVFNYGWMLYGPTIQTLPLNRVQVTLEYHFGLWPELIYGQMI